MKNILESAEVFEAYATIDLCYYMLKDLAKEYVKPKHPLHTIIDEATGYGAVLTKKATEDSIDLLEQIITAKKTIDADYDSDEKMLQEIKELKL